MMLSIQNKLNSAHDVYDKWGFTLKNSHNRGAKDKLDQHECNCGGAIMYDMGICGVAWLVHKSENNNELSEKLSSNAMNLAEKYTWQAKASNFIKLIQTNIN